MAFNNIYYRICVLNDFRDTKAVVDYRKYGENVEILDAFIIGGQHKGYVENKDTIGIFLNYKLLAEFKVKAEAIKFIDDLIEKAPKEAKKDMVEYRHYLIRSIE